ncbi:MAG: glycine cleavage system aminomethyltransferase GcvT [Deltaproteobacteria bacterium]|nr:glycine cleavage system aminomethyltransferase GcvT [Deltaproteobacteria bacterium]
MTELARTPLFEAHVELGARMVEFAGFSMPVQYTSIKQEHAAVRARAGLFDVSHMGQIHFRGPRAVTTVERLVSCRVDSLAVGRVRYGLLCNDGGGCVDDVTVYREADDALFLCVNAANIAKDVEWIRRHAPDRAGVEDRSTATGLLALQGPACAALLQALAKEGNATPVGELGRFRFARYEVAASDCLVSRTGYTGADGFEIYTPAGATRTVWDALLAVGEPHGLTPAGLGARDTLRLEAALPLYGHELDDTTSPLEAGLGRFVKRKRGGFIGHEAIEARDRKGATRQLIGFEMEGRGIARAGYVIADRGREVGVVTSGAPSPTLGKSIGLGYVPPRLAEPGRAIDIVIRDKRVAARVVETPFV